MVLGESLPVMGLEKLKSYVHVFFLPQQLMRSPIGIKIE